MSELYLLNFILTQHNEFFHTNIVSQFCDRPTIKWTSLMILLHLHWTIQLIDIYNSKFGVGSRKDTCCIFVQWAEQNEFKTKTLDASQFILMVHSKWSSQMCQQSWRETYLKICLVTLEIFPARCGKMY